MNLHQHLLAVTVALLLSACDQNTSTSPAASAPPITQLAVPELPRRTVELGSPDEYDQLRDAYDKNRLALAKNPNDLDAWLRLSEVFITEARITGNFGSNYTAALGILDHVLARATGDKEKARRSEAFTLKAAVKLSQHQFQEALVLGQEAVQLDPHRAFNYGVLVDANVELGRYEEAVRMSDKMVSTRPDLRSYSRISYLREIHGDVPGAMEAMRMAVQAGYPGAEETSWCRTVLGRLHENSGDLKNAEAEYVTAITERPNYPPAMAAMGRLALKKGDPAKAEEWLVKAIALMPDAHYYCELARVHQATRQEVARGEALAKAEEILLGLGGPGAQGTHTHGGDFHSHGASDAEAHNHEHDHDGTKHSHAHDGSGEHAHVHATNDHGHSHEVGLEMGRFELEFHHDLDAALANGLHEYGLRPDNIEVNALLAGAYYAKGDLDNARMHLDKARRMGTQDAYTTCLAGLIETKSGNAKDGATLIAQAFKMDPHQMHAFADEAHRMN